MKELGHSRPPSPIQWSALTLLALVTFAAFAPVFGAEFVSWDDGTNFVSNPQFRGLGPANLEWMWTTTLLGHYVPLAWMTLGLDYLLWGMNPSGYHFTNVVLHVANVWLVYAITARMLGLIPVTRTTSHADRVFAAAFAALCFGIHPLRVESVAWITERRDVLSLLFVLLTIRSYLGALTDPPRFRRRYLTALLWFIAAVLAKGSAVSLPAVLLVLQLYLASLQEGWTRSLRSYADGVARLLPFFAVAAVVGMLSIVAVKPPAQLSIAGKLAVSAYSLVFYIVKTVLPVRLSPLYEMPEQVNPVSPLFLASYAAVILLAVAIWWVGRRRPGIAASALGFLAMVLPFLGLVQNGPQIAADRYTYLASIALSGVVACVILRVGPGIPRWSVATVLIATLGAATWRQTRVWHDSHSLWSHVVAIDESSGHGHNNLGVVLAARGDIAGAMEHYQRAIASRPNYADSYSNLGLEVAGAGNRDSAMKLYRRAIALRPDHAAAHNNLGLELAESGDLASAIQHYESAIRLKPDFADARINLANALCMSRRCQDALVHYAVAATNRPSDPILYFNWGLALEAQGQNPAAASRYRQALSIDPTFGDARGALARVSR